MFSSSKTRLPAGRQASITSAGQAVVIPVAIVNLFLMALAGVLVLFYVVQANAIAADQYLMQTLSEKAFALSDTRMTLAQQRAQLEDPELLASFALEHNMVEAKEASYVFEGKNVAYQR